MLAGRDDESPPLGPAVDRFDMEIVEFVLSWVPYGGPPTEECVPHFGMTRDRLLSRFREIVHTGERRHLAAAELAKLERATALVGVRTVSDSGMAAGRRVLRQGIWHWA